MRDVAMSYGFVWVMVSILLVAGAVFALVLILKSEREGDEQKAQRLWRWAVILTALVAIAAIAMIIGVVQMVQAVPLFAEHGLV